MISSSSWRREALTHRLSELSEVQFWREFAWADSEERNMDQAPTSPSFGCPACGSVWGELLAYGFIAPRITEGVIMAFCDDGPLIAIHPRSIIGAFPWRALRMKCVRGHECEWDPPTDRKRVLPSWDIALTIGAMAIAAAYILPILGSKHLKGIP